MATLTPSMIEAGTDAVAKIVGDKLLAQSLCCAVACAVWAAMDKAAPATKVIDELVVNLSLDSSALRCEVERIGRAMMECAERMRHE